MQRFTTRRRRSSPRASTLPRVLLLAGTTCCALGLGLLGACASFPEPDDGREGWPTPEVGVVVSEHPLATQAGLSILEVGGNAADAAVATALALAVVYPQAGNLGGGGFAIWVPHDVEREPLALDFRETAPVKLKPELFLDERGSFVPERSLGTHLGVGVPGTPYGLWELQKRCGKLSFIQVAQPAIALAEDGFEVEVWLEQALLAEKSRARLEASPAARALFYPGGRPLRAGDRLRQVELGNTLRQLAQWGPPGFYEGRVAEALLAEMRRGGGVLEREDLSAYRAKWREPLRGWFRGLEIVTVPPPSSGGLILLQVLSILDGFPLDEERETTLVERSIESGAPVSADDPGLSSRALHWWIEAMRLAFADRAVHMDDPDFRDVPVQELLSPEWIAQRRTSVGERANPDVGAMPVPFPESGETTHLSTLDRDGNAVSLTTTLNTSFGTGVMVPGAGFLLNNEIDDFAIVEGMPNAYGLVGRGANRILPGKRPLSSMSPTVVRDGGKFVRMVLGSPGGPRIITAVLQVILRVEVYEQDLQAALAAPRLHQQWAPSSTRFEPGWDPELLSDLRYRHHAVDEVDQRMGSVQAIFVEMGGVPYGFSDPRRGGAAGIEGGEISTPARPRPTAR